MFSWVPDASKIAFVHLVKQLQYWEFGLIDCQVKTSHLESLGAREISRTLFSQKLDALLTRVELSGKWDFDRALIE
jgi:leucyl/phenylalanyl-tRNA--protein transferase